MANNGDIQLIATLDESSSEAEILRVVKIISDRIKTNAKIELKMDVDTVSIEKVLKKLEAISKSKDLSVDTKNSIVNLQKEADAMLDVAGSANKAAKEKLEFANANKRVAESANNTSRAIANERNAMQSLDDLDYILRNINMQGQVGNGVFQQFGNTLRDAFYVFTAANLLQDSIYKVIDGGKEAVETVKELNDAATSLRMATGDSYSSVKQLMSEYNAMAQELGSITTGVSDAADVWLRQGHTIEDTNTLIKDSMMLSKVSELESAESTKYLTSAMQGYKVAVEDVEGIVDKLSAVDLESATDAGGLAEAMSRTAEGAQIAGVSMDRLLGMIATVGEVTQKSMSSIGESFKTVFSRMRDIKDNKLSVIGEDGEIEDLSNVEIVLDSLGIKLRDSNLEFRNFQNVLDDVAGSWDSYSSVQKAAIAKAFSGVRQQENFLVMMENWDKVLEYTNVAMGSQGTASDKFGYYLESLESKTNSLKASLENLASTTISDELYGSVLDTTKAIVDMTAESGILKGALTGLGTAGSIYAFKQLTGYLRNATQEFSNFGQALSITTSSQVGISEMQNLINLTGGLTQSQTHLLLSTNNLTDAQKVAVIMNQRLAQGLPQITEDEALQQLQTMGVATAQGTATGTTISLTSAMRGLWATLVANPLVLVTTTVTAGVMAWKHYKQAQEKANEKIEESRSAYEETTSTLESMNSELETTKQRIEELESKGTLSFTDKAELDNLKEQNNELERNIQLQEKKQQNKSNEVVANIKDNKKDLDKDFDKSFNDYKKYLSEYNLAKEQVQKGILAEDELDKYENKFKESENALLEKIETFEQYKKDITNKYGTTDTSEFSVSDKNLYDDITAQLQEAYKQVYTDSEYNKIIIEPIFDKEELEGLQDELLNYFANGGTTDLSALEDKFGSDIISALKTACENAGIDFNKMIGDIYNNSQSKLNQIAPIVQNPNSAYEAKQNNVSKEIRDYIQNDLSEEDRTLLLDAEIPDDVKFNTIQDVNDFIDEINENLSDEVDLSAPQSFIEAWEALGNTEDDTLKGTRDDLLALAEAGQLTEDSFNNTTGADTFLDQISLSASEAIIKINELANSSTQLSSMGKQISAISEALATKFSDGFVDADTLSGFDASVRGLDTWKEFEETLGDSKSSIEECQNAANALATEYVNSNNFLSKLTDENKDYYITQLDKMGVDNAAEIVTNSLKNQEEALAQAEIFVAQKKRENANESYNLSNATASEIQKFAEETNMASSTATSLLQLALKKQYANNITLDFSGDIANIRDLVAAIGSANTALSTLAAMKAANGTGGMPSSVLNKIKNNAKNEVNNALNKNTTEVKVNAGGGSSNKGGGGGSSKSDSKTTIDWIQRKLERLQKIIDATKAKLENLFTVKAKTSNLDDQIKQTTNLLNAEEKAAKKYKSYADKYAKSSGLSKSLIKKIQSGDYSISDYSSKTADKINKYKELYDNYKEAQQQIDELTTTIRQLKEEKYQVYIDDAEANIDRLNALID